MDEKTSRPLPGRISKAQFEKIMRAAKPGRYNDRPNYDLELTRIGGRVTGHAIYRFTLHGKRRWMGLGGIRSYADLVRGRQRQWECEEIVYQGRDPIAERRARKAEDKAKQARVVTFRKAVQGFLKQKARDWNRVHRHQWDMTLERDVLPVIGDLPLDAIRQSDIHRIIDPLAESTPATAKRILGRTCAVWKWARDRGLVRGDNPAGWSFNDAYAPPDKIKPVRNHPAMPYDQVPAFMAKLASEPDLRAVALMTVVLSAGRLSEILKATWSEFDLASGLWVLPPERTKQRREHRVPLSRRLVELLDGLPRHGAFVFADPQRPTRPLGEKGLRNLLFGLGGAGLTFHGFRSSFRDFAGDRTNFAREVAEAALGHAVGDETERSYRRGDALESLSRRLPSRRLERASAAAHQCGRTSSIP